ncbi:hypothetical protein PGT21_016053 [Puccinia graminis f. sp. tritici]|uniref:Uncharacterized protein n=1 Tax=Puccinia graminis f. sp. tritici TaxID=56615 RepID=A0A5B0PP60_PUCGR|nr:hypothetical protein PGTUg99_033465 [Puccinia graminis f. sp. tritici]KAA1114623.1 hypothetical protein PGT21_016053 [Puccinia graminis f. sp. tritici]
MKFWSPIILLFTFSHFTAAIQPFHCGKKSLHPFPTCGYVNQGVYHLAPSSTSQCADTQICYCCHIQYGTWAATNPGEYDNELRTQCKPAF